MNDELGVLELVVLIPDYQMSLCCSRAERAPSKASQNQKFWLNRTASGKAQLQAIIDAVQQAPDSAIIIRPTRKNEAFVNKVRQHNKEVQDWLQKHPEDDFTKEINPKDLVRMIDVSHYDASFTANDGTDMHAFKDIWVPQLTEDFEKVVERGGKRQYVSLTLYVKLRKVGDNIDVVSLHTGEEN